MRIKSIAIWGLIFGLFGGMFLSCQPAPHYEVLVVGGGASGSMAGIQSARMGAKTLIIEEGPWLGGMLTSAGVSAIDGNYKLYSGLWEEFRQKLYEYYGGADKVRTGWVSSVLFEPSVGAGIILQMARQEPNLEVKFGHRLVALKKEKQGWTATVEADNQTFTIKAKVVVDGTELGDVAAMTGVPYDIGMDSRYDTGESIAPEKANDIIQDLTYVVVLEDFGPGVDKTIPRPENYDPTPFYCCCAGKCDPDTITRTLWECGHMLQYGRLPNNKFMINWPIYGNDYYLNIIEMSPAERLQALEKAKWFTRCFIYYIQTELGFSNLGIAQDEFPTEDGFPLIPYHRESRRIQGVVRFGIEDLARPFLQQEALYRTGIAVGDYPVDHHHAAYHDQTLIPDLHFYPVPSYALPLGTLIPQAVSDLIVAEKSISVTNIVNGTTRLQPVCILLGQAAGALAALSVELKVTPGEVPVRLVQQRLLDSGAYIMPYSDVVPGDPFFEAVQRIGATGLIKGEGKNVGWQNFTYFHPDSVMTSEALTEGLKDLVPQLSFAFSGEKVTVAEAVEVGCRMASVKKAEIDRKSLEELAQQKWEANGWGQFLPDRPVTRTQAAVILDALADPFTNFPVSHTGKFIADTGQMAK